MERAVHDLAATAIDEAEVHGRPLSEELCQLQFGERFWAAVPPWLETELHPMIAAFQAHGERCVHVLATAMLTRLLARERYLAHNVTFTSTIRDERNLWLTRKRAQQWWWMRPETKPGGATRD